MTRTSIHRLNGDRPLPFGATGKVAYFLFNWLNNRLPTWRLDPRMTIRDFRCTELASRIAQVPAGSSPSRTLSDLFWLTLPWERMRSELGCIRVSDVGCGAGEYGRRLIKWSDNRVASYVGLDVQAHDGWATSDPRLQFIRADASASARVIPTGTNLIISQSAIEHMDHDLRFFEHVRDYIRQVDGPVLQVHLCPSPACLKLYLLHGVRQYNPRTLSTISQLFEDSDVVLYRLGGHACNRLHYEFITSPLMIRHQEDFRVTRAADYKARLVAAIAEDMAGPQRSPAFYALVMHTRPRTRLF